MSWCNSGFDVLVLGPQAAINAAKKSTRTILIVMISSIDPVAAGHVASLAHPGGNLTGLSNFAAELSGKRLELIKEIIPKLPRVAVLGTSTVPGNTQALKETELAAGAYKVQL